MVLRCTRPSAYVLHEQSSQMKITSDWSSGVHNTILSSQHNNDQIPIQERQGRTELICLLSSRAQSSVLKENIYVSCEVHTLTKI